MELDQKLFHHSWKEECNAKEPKKERGEKNAHTYGGSPAPVKSIVGYNNPSYERSNPQ